MDTFDKQELIYLRACVQRDPRGLASTAEMLKKLDDMIAESDKPWGRGYMLTGLTVNQVVTRFCEQGDAVEVLQAVCNSMKVTIRGTELVDVLSVEKAKVCANQYVDSWWQRNETTGEVEFCHVANRELPDWVTRSKTFKVVREGKEWYQLQIGRWMHECFEPQLYGNMQERGDRFLEEALELLQSGGYDKSRVATLVEYVYSRPPGEPGQEVGGVMVTLAGYCHIAGISMWQEAEDELRRIRQPKVMEKIRNKQASKRDIHGPLP